MVRVNEVVYTESLRLLLHFVLAGDVLLVLVTTAVCKVNRRMFKGGCMVGALFTY